MAEVDLKAKLTVAPKVTSATVTEDKKVELKWTKVPLAEKYDIKRSLSCNGEYGHVDWATALTFTDGSVKPDTTYWYKIIGWKRMEGKKTSQKASAVKAVVVSDIPGVKNLCASADGGKIRLEWDKADADKYYIYRRCDYFSAMFFIGESRTNGYLDEGAASGQVYHYCVQPVKISDGAERHGNFSNEVSYAFVDTTDILSVKKVFGGKALVDVRIIAGADGYIFERSDKKDGEFTEVGRTEDITAVNFEEKLPSKLKTYYYRVCAYKKIGNRELKGGYSSVKAAR